jgi:hypothetical protein
MVLLLRGWIKYMGILYAGTKSVPNPVAWEDGNDRALSGVVAELE